MTKERKQKVKEPRGMRLQERDIAIGEWLVRRRFLDADQICRLVENLEGGSHAHTKTRLTALRENGYIIQPRGERSYWDETGRTYRIYGNTSKMGRLLQKRGKVEEGRLDWTQQNRQGKAHFVEHTVETSELMVTFEQTARKYPGVCVRETDELLGELPERTQAMDKPWYVAGAPAGFPATARKIIKPDAVFNVRHETKDGAQEQFFFAEIDTTNMPVVRGGKLEKALQTALAELHGATGKAAKAAAQQRVEGARQKLLVFNARTDQSSFLHKMMTYFWAYKTGWHKEHFGWPSMRVLVTTRKASQRDRMIRTLPYITDGLAPNLFLFSTFEEIRGCDDVMRHEWFNGAGERVTLSK